MLAIGELCCSPTTLVVYSARPECAIIAYKSSPPPFRVLCPLKPTTAPDHTIVWPIEERGDRYDHIIIIIFFGVHDCGFASLLGVHCTTDAIAHPLFAEVTIGF